MSNAYERFLELCECSTDERTMSLFLKACDRWGVSETEIQDACISIPRMYHVEHRGIRRLLGLYVSEWIAMEDLWNRDAFRIYYNVPGSVTAMLWLKSCIQKSLKKEVYAGSPDLIAMIVLYGIIQHRNKLESRSCRHCAVNMMRKLQTEEEMIPEPDIRWTNGLVCDEAPAMDMLLRNSETSCYNAVFIKAAKYGDQCNFLLDSLEKTLGEIRLNFGVETDPAVYTKIKTDRFCLAVNIETISQFLNRERKFYIGNADVTLIETLLLTSFDLGMKTVLDVTEEIFEDMMTAKKNSNTDNSVSSIEHAFTVYYTPTCNSEYALTFERNGIALLFPTALKSKAVPVYDVRPEEDIVYEAMEMLIGKSCEIEAAEISSMMQENKLDGMVLGMFTFDRWMGAHQNLLKKRIEGLTGKPVLVYETDFWNQESWNHDRMETTVETLKGMLEQNAY